MKEVIIDFLSYLGVSPKYEGYKYIVDASLLVNKKVMSNEKVIAMEMFNIIANKYNTNYMCVEKDIRVCIEGLFKNGNIKNINNIFESISTYYDDRPSNKLFFMTIVNYLNKDK